ncbi:MAG: hypothetical protein ACPLOV_02715 [Thermovenabulum sp.]
MSIIMMSKSDNAASSGDCTWYELDSSLSGLSSIYSDNSSKRSL